MDTNHTRYICVQCVAAYSAAGFCPNHPDEPLLDTRDETVREYLAALDAKRLRKKIGWALLATSVTLGPLLFKLTSWLVGLLFESGERAAGSMRFLTVLVGGAFIGTALESIRRMMVVRHRNRFADWTLETGFSQDGDVLDDIDGMNSSFGEKMVAMVHAKNLRDPSDRHRKS